MFDIPIGADRKKIRKEINDIFSEARQKGKPERCILCGEVQTSLCNSHSVPKMSLKAIADNGMLLHASAAIGLNMEVVNLEDGINRSGTFNYICRKCDSSFFQDYENLNSLIAYPSDKMLAKIAVKNFLLQLSKRAIIKVRRVRRTDNLTTPALSKRSRTVSFIPLRGTQAIVAE